MPLLALSHVTFRYAAETVLEDATITVERGRKIGVIGQNGVGKSTLLRILAGVLEPSAGDVIRERGVKVAFQVQEPVYAPGATVRDEMRRVLADDIARTARLAEVEHALAGADDREQQRLLAEYERLQRDHAAGDGWNVERRIEAVLSSLGLPADAWDQQVERFSGGERNVVGLAGVLLSDPDVMLLDEPTNHLDIQACEQLEHMLRGFDGTLLVISHDRWFLDGLVDRVVELQDRKLHVFHGSFSEWWEDKHRRGEDVRRAALELRSRKDAASPDKDAARLEREERRARQATERRLKKEIARAEERIERLEARKAELSALLQDAYAPGADLGADLDRARALTDELRDTQAELARVEATWDELARSLSE